MQRLNSWLKQPWLRGVVLVIILAGAALLGRTQWRQTQSQPVGRVVITGPDPELETANDYFEAGNTEFDQKHYDNAIADYSEALVLDPNYAEAYNNRAYTYMVQEKYAPALDDLNQAIALRPDYVNALMNRGDIYNYYYETDTAKAMADYDRVLALNPNNPNLCGHRLLAEHNGWNFGTLGDLIQHGQQSGCK